MARWWKKVKKPLILLGIVFVILALFFVPAIGRGFYETTLGEASAYPGKNVIEVMLFSLNKFGENIKICFGPGFSSYLIGLEIFGIFYLAFVAAMLIRISMRSDYERIEHGSADWCTQNEAYQILDPKKGMILADKYYLPVLPEAPTGKNGNILVIGGSGAGKSASFVIPNALQQLGSYVFTDPKGELYDRTAGFFKRKGYEVHVINLVDPRYSDGYNPLSHIRGTIDVDTVAKIISNKEGGDKKGSDPFWDQTSEALLKAVIYYILLNRPKEEHSLSSCLALVRLGGENEGEDLRDLFMALPFDNPARKAFETIRLGSEKTFSNILVSLAAKLEAFDSPEISAMTSTNTIEFPELINKKSVLYFITPATNDTYNFIMNIFFSQMLDRLYEYADTLGGKLPTPLFLILDEFANIGRIPRFEQILSTCRSYRINISIILQSIDQLIAIYDEKVTENIMANCSTHLFLGSNAQKTLETFSKQLGEKTITRDNVSRSTDKESNFSGRSYSDQIMARALMTPDELRRMESDTCIILIQAVKPIKAKKYFYWTMHPAWKEAKTCEANHRAIEAPARGEYKITNPYELQSMDDIFGPSTSPVQPTQSRPVGGNVEVDMGGIAPASAQAPKTSAAPNLDIMGAMGTPAARPAAPASKPKDEPMIQGNIDDYDLQAELEKKFDELFGDSYKKNNTY